MPRRPRVHLDWVPLHIVQRDHNRGACFWRLLLDDQNRHAYLSWLHEALLREGCHLHAEVLMTNHGHLLLTPPDAHPVPRVLIAVGQRNIELNPVRAGMVVCPTDYPWSTYRANGLGERNPIRSPHPLYLALAGDTGARHEADRALFRTALDDIPLADLHMALN